MAKESQLATFEQKLNATTKELKLAQATYIKAQERLATAEKEHELARVAFLNEATTIKNASEVSKVV